MKCGYAVLLSLWQNPDIYSRRMLNASGEKQFREAVGRERRNTMGSSNDF